jgi:hypothetical protein
VCHRELQFDFLSDRPVVVKFSDLELSSDAGILLACQAEGNCQNWSLKIHHFARKYSSSLPSFS